MKLIRSEIRNAQEDLKKIIEEKIDEVHHVTKNQQQTNVQIVVTACSIFRTTIHRIMIEYLLLKPYNAQFVQKLDEEDLQDRVQMWKTLMPMLEDNDTHESLSFSCEVTFYLHGLVNKNNARYWCETNLRVIIGSIMESPKLNVW